MPEPGDGRNHARRRAMRSPRTSTPVTRVAVGHAPAPARRCALPRRGLDEGARGLRVHLVQRASRQRERRRRRAPDRTSRRARARTAPRAASSGDWLSAASASGSQSQSVSCSVCPRSRSHCDTGEVAVDGHACPFAGAPAAPPAATGAIRRTERRSRHGIASHVEHRAEQVQRRREPGHSQHRTVAGPIQVRHAQRRLTAHVALGTDTLQELERLRDSSRRARAARCPRARRSRDR